MQQKIFYDQMYSSVKAFTLMWCAARGELQLSSEEDQLNLLAKVRRLGDPVQSPRHVQYAAAVSWSPVSDPMGCWSLSRFPSFASGTTQSSSSWPCFFGALPCLLVECRMAAKRKKRARPKIMRHSHHHSCMTRAECGLGGCGVAGGQHHFSTSGPCQYPARARRC